MLDTVNDYSKSWRFNFNPAKTIEVTFGESNRSNLEHNLGRKWLLVKVEMEEKPAWDHIGNILFGDFSNNEICNAASRKGKEVVSCMLSGGVRPGGLNPISGVDIWRTVGLSKMLYGAESWLGINKTYMERLEITNRFAEKRIQGLAPLARSVAAIGSIGLWTIEGYINKAKLLFLHKLITSPPTPTHQILFIKRLFNYIYGAVEKPGGFIPDIVGILVKYDLCYILDDYIKSGNTHSHLTWKKEVINRIHEHELEQWKNEISQIIELRHFYAKHSKLEPLQLCQVAKRNPIYINDIASSVNIL